MDRYMNIGGKMVKIGSWIPLPNGETIWVSCMKFVSTLTQD